MDQDERARLRAQAPATYTRVEQGQPLGLGDVKAMSAAGLSDDVIINNIFTKEMDVSTFNTGELLEASATFTWSVVENAWITFKHTVSYTKHKQVSSCTFDDAEYIEKLMQDELGM